MVIGILRTAKLILSSHQSANNERKGEINKIRSSEGQDFVVENRNTRNMLRSEPVTRNMAWT